jgi:hypothetical protein
LTCTDSFGGHCPNCGYNKIMLRYGSGTYYEFDACPRCGFAFGTNGIDPAREGDNFWTDAIEVHSSYLSVLGFPLTREGIFMWHETLPDANRDDFNVFQYTKEDIERIMHKLTNKDIYGLEKVMLN